MEKPAGLWHSATMLIAQITDLHIRPAGRLAYGRVDTATHLESAVATLLALDPLPDVVLATGDLVDAGEPEEYARLRRLLAPIDRPLFVVPGNHDSRRPLFEAFGSAGYLPGEAGAWVRLLAADGAALRRGLHSAWSAVRTMLTGSVPQPRRK